MKTLTCSIVSILGLVAPVFAQQLSPIEIYTRNDMDYTVVANLPPLMRTIAQIDNILPLSKSTRFSDYVVTKASPVDLSGLREAVERLRLDKQVGSTAGAAGITSLISRVAAPGALGIGVEYGSLLQNTNGIVTTVRGNLLGITRMVAGVEPFVYCPEIDQNNCQPAARWLRRFSGMLAFENSQARTATASATVPASTTPTAVDLFGSNFRMASWGARFDIATTDTDDPKYVAAWRTAMNTLRASDTGPAFTLAISNLFSGPVGGTADPIYVAWRVETIPILMAAPVDQFRRIFEERLDILIARMSANPAFRTRINSVRRTFANYSTVRDELLKEIHSHRSSIEYTNQHPLSAPSTSNLRFIYSHQPTRSPSLLTFNAGLTWYNSLAAGNNTSRFRDVQIAGQLDRRLGEIPNLGNAVLTLGGYYQWMKEDALIVIGPGNVAPGSGIILPGTAAKLLGTKGSIGVVQGKLTIPVNGSIRIPISVTWANRTELIKESDVRGQVGITLDFDSVFK